MIDPCCLESAEREPWPDEIGRERLLASVYALVECERQEHAGLELWGAMRAMLGMLVLVMVAVAWRRR